jgi:hypothetical protein
MTAHSALPTIVPVTPIEAPANWWIWMSQIAERVNLIIAWIEAQPVSRRAEMRAIEDSLAAIEERLRVLEERS